MKKTLRIILFCIMAVCIGAFCACSNTQDDSVSFELNAYLVKINIGETYDLNVEGTIESATFVSTNTSSAEVDNSGVITAKYTGFTNIVVSVGEVDKICSVQVVENPVGLVLDKSGAREMIVGDTITVNATLTKGGQALAENVEWSLSNENCQKQVNGNTAIISATQSGETVLTASYQDVSASLMLIIRSNQAQVLVQPQITSASCVSIEWEEVVGAETYAVKVGDGTWQTVEDTQFAITQEMALDGGILAVRAVANTVGYFDGMPAYIAVEHVFNEDGYEGGNAPTCTKSEHLIYQCDLCTAKYTKEVYGHVFKTGEGDCSLCGEDRVTEGLSFKLNDDGTGYVVNDYKGTDREIYVPGVYNGLPVLSVASGNVFGDIVPTMIFFNASETVVDGVKTYQDIAKFEDVVRVNNANLEKLVYNGMNITRNLFVSASAIKTIIMPNMMEIPVNRIADNPSPTPNLKKLVVNPKVNIGVYSVCSGSVDLYVLGAAEQDQITIGVGNGGLTGKKYYYDEKEPTGCETSTWHWVDGEPTAWQASHDYLYGTCTVCGEEIHTDGLKLVKYDNWCNIQGYTGTSTEVYIPSFYGGKKVYYADTGTEFNGKGITLIRFGVGFHCGMSKNLINSCGDTLKTVIWLDSAIEKYQFGNAPQTLIIPNITELITGGVNDSTGAIRLRKLVVNEKVDIKAYAVRKGEGLVDIYSLGGTATTDIKIGSNNEGLSGNIYYYSEIEPTDTTNTYWHYVNGEPTLWSK